jgi:ribonucleoside-diphosphate reductase alpha chain
MIESGPKTNIAIEIDKMKYRQPNESFEGKVERIARTLSDTQEHYAKAYEILSNMRFLPAGRVQTAIGSPRAVTAFNCFVSAKIEDSMDSIMDRAKEASETMRRGGGIGYNFGHLRPHGDWIKSLESKASGPISFMKIYDSICQTISSSGHRRGAQMGVFPINHPDVEAFINAKTNQNELTGFNVSLAVTDKFMKALENDDPFPLEFGGKVYKTVQPKELWDTIMRNTWDWAEPGVLFIDRINKMNNLYYCEKIEATNPCGEQPLPPYGACLLGSFNLVKYIKSYQAEATGQQFVAFDYDKFKSDIPEVVRMMDNVIDNTIYPLEKQKEEAISKRRMGLGITGLANCAEILGFPYASDDFIEFQEEVLKTLRDDAYMTSAVLAEEKGSFPMFDKEKYLSGRFVKTLSPHVKDHISKFGIRNSHLTSIAPTGTISLSADNISSGIEPPFSHYYDRTLRTFEGDRVERVEDYAYARGYECRTSDEITAAEHLKILLTSQKYVDSACSKTCNIGDDVSFNEFKDLYYDAWKGGAKGLTTFRASGKRFGILVKPDEEEKNEACYINPETGTKECDL